MYAVVDLETTGLWANAHDRVIEVAIVRTDDECRPLDEWATLINPQRDLGPVSIHGITGRDVADAPAFSDIAGDIVERLANSIFVGHNVRFDVTFLAAEFKRLGVELPVIEGLCTLDLAASLDLGTSLALDACCRKLDIHHEGAHTALGDARATATLLGACLRRIERCNLPSPVAWEILPQLSPSGRTRPRAAHSPPPGASLARFLSQVPPAGGFVEADPAAIRAYTDLLDKTLEDRLITPDEVDALVELADAWGLSREVIAEIHRSYLTSLVAIALADNVLTDAEHRDLALVAEVLGFDQLIDDFVRAVPPNVIAAVVPQDRRHELAGRSVCFTGESVCSVRGLPLDRSTQEFLAASAGMVVAPRVTKKLDILVVADPHSLSGKARTAQEYGVRRLAERAFWTALGVSID